MQGERGNQSTGAEGGEEDTRERRSEYVAMEVPACNTALAHSMAGWAALMHPPMAPGTCNDAVHNSPAV
jgi:hypothetical protein